LSLEVRIETAERVEDALRLGGDAEALGAGGKTACADHEASRGFAEADDRPFERVRGCVDCPTIVGGRSRWRGVRAANHDQPERGGDRQQRRDDRGRQQQRLNVHPAPSESVRRSIGVPGRPRMAHDGRPNGQSMNAILYPVAASAEEALERPRGRAAREREAVTLAGQPVRFVTEAAKKVFASREAALDACNGRLDDDRPGRIAHVAPEDRFVALRERLTGEHAPAPAVPAFAGGRRWPRPAARPRTVFEVVVSYWRIETGARPQTEGGRAQGGQARTLRRRQRSHDLGPEELRALAERPLRPVEPQQPLDFGLFEAPTPEAPHIVIPDE
jgi:hypothetical protein